MRDETLSFGFPKPGRALIGAMAVLVVIWVFLAVTINWGGFGTDVFDALVGSRAILRGEVWRILTCFLVHQPSGPGSVGHLLTSVLGLYFLGASLEQRWGAKRFLTFLLIAGVASSLLQLVVGSLIQTLGQPRWYGALGVIDAVAIAWALSFRGQQVRLFLVLPVSGTMMIAFIVGMNILYVIAMEVRPDGLITPFGGMLAGFLMADGSPVRRAYLNWKLQRLKAQSAALSSGPKGRGRAAHLTVIRGGQADEKKPDKSMLN